MRRNELARLSILIIVLVSASYGAWAGLRFILQTEYPVLVVVSGSMIPTLNQGDIIIIRGVDLSQVSKGVIIVFRSPRDEHTLIVHRVQEIVKSSSGLFFVTKGDNNPVPDNWNPSPGVPAKLVVGSYIGRVPYVGFIVMKMREPMGIAIIVLAMGVILLLELSDRRKRTKR